MKNKTKEMFAETLKTLMKTKTLSQIRVSELCELCGANRRTFYYHFEDKYDLVAWIMASSSATTMEKFPHFGVERMVYSLYKNMQDQAFSKKLYQDPGMSNCFDFIVKRTVAHYMTQIRSLRGRDLTEDEIFSVRMLTYGELYMFREWYLDDCKMPPEELAERIVANFPAWIRELF